MSSAGKKLQAPALMRGPYWSRHLAAHVVLTRRAFCTQPGPTICSKNCSVSLLNNKTKKQKNRKATRRNSLIRWKGDWKSSHSVSIQFYGNTDIEPVRYTSCFWLTRKREKFGFKWEASVKAKIIKEWDILLKLAMVSKCHDSYSA